MQERRILHASKDVLGEVLSGALETMAFICPLPLEQPPAPPPLALSITIDFELGGGEVLELVAGEEFGRMLASNILADPSTVVDSTTARDALRELVNVTCGNLLNRLGATAAEMGGMTIPVIVPFDPHGWATFIARPDTAVVDAEGHILGARLGRAA